MPASADADRATDDLTEIWVITPTGVITFVLATNVTTRSFWCWSASWVTAVWPRYSRTTPRASSRWGAVLGRTTLLSGSAVVALVTPGGRPGTVAAAIRDGWRADGEPGFVYTVNRDGRPVVRARMHWVRPL